MAALIDTNILLALVYPRDTNHAAARLAMQGLKADRIVPISVLPEVFDLVADRMTYADGIRAFQLIRSSAFNIEPLTAEDMGRMMEIMTQYEDNAFDFVDVSIMAIAERLNITEIYTFDHRDFRVFRPRHSDYLVLLP